MFWLMEAELLFTFADIIQKDLAKPKEDRQFAVLWVGGLSPSDPIFREAFSDAFADYFRQCRPGVNCGSSLNKKEVGASVEAITKQWFGKYLYM